jgi:16S rRNA processing protein RimM
MFRKPEKRDPENRQIGRVLRPHGVQGELRVEVFTDDAHLFDRETLLLGVKMTQLATYEVESLRMHQGRALLKLVGVDDRDGADALRDWLVCVPRGELPPLEEGEFYLYELVGMQVVTDEGELLGKVGDVLRTGANDVLVVSPSTAVNELLLPDIPEVVLNINRESQTITVHLLEGLR